MLSETIYFTRKWKRDFRLTRKSLRKNLPNPKTSCKESIGLVQCIEAKGVKGVEKHASCLLSEVKDLWLLIDFGLGNKLSKADGLDV